MLPKISTNHIKSIKTPKDLRKLNSKQLNELAGEIRSLLIKTVAANGGHLASNLGTVDLTIALHRAYNSPKDKLIWDVGHQAYTHKILTGRANDFKTIRKLNGLSGYLKVEESPHDAFGAGHAGTAVSAALGIAAGRDLKKENFEVVAIIGDGSLTNGLTYEGINNAGNANSNITIILNDNKFSISKNVGGMAKYLEKLSAIRIDENPPTDMESIFRALGFTYFGPIDGHNIELMTQTFELAKKTAGPKIIHVLTKKGNGYLFSEKNPSEFHSVSPFILESGKVEKDTKNLTYTKAFSNALIRLGKKDKALVAITAAMPAGTGTEKFAKLFPERFFDVGIAEEHAVTFAAGLATQGMKPVVAVYSTFLQRSYDEILHDVALQKLPVVFAIDRAGLVGSDGPTHHGIFDLSYLRSIPNIVVMAPQDENELGHMLYTATNFKEGPIAIRYPRGDGHGTTIDREFKKIPIGKAKKISVGNDGSIIAIGSMVYPAMLAAEILKENGVSVSVYNARFAKPIDKEMIEEAAKTGPTIVAEENILDGGFGSGVLEELERLKIYGTRVARIGITDFITHGEPTELKEICRITPKYMAESFKKLLTKD